MPRPRTEASTYKLFPFRFPEELMAQFRQRAKQRHRSCNAEAIEMMQHWLACKEGLVVHATSEERHRHKPSISDEEFLGCTE